MGSVKRGQHDDPWLDRCCSGATVLARADSAVAVPPCPTLSRTAGWPIEAPGGHETSCGGGCILRAPLKYSDVILHPLRRLPPQGDGGDGPYSGHDEHRCC
jgi:hypothetical protein